MLIFILYTQLYVFQKIKTAVLLVPTEGAQRQIEKLQKQENENFWSGERVFKNVHHWKESQQQK